MLKVVMFIQNRYEIISKIGSGGMADVYKAKDHKLNRFVAVKVLKKEFRDDREFISKFRVEAQSAAGLAHANIVNIYDTGEEAGIYYIVMELVEGITLKEYIKMKGRGIDRKDRLYGEGRLLLCRRVAGWGTAVYRITACLRLAGS